MACDEGLVERIRAELTGFLGLGERRMFGGVCFTMHGNMLCGVVKDMLMARIGVDAYDPALSQAHVKPMDFSGKPMRGYIYVESEGLAEDDQLCRWLHACKAFVSTLPIKPAKSSPKAATTKVAKTAKTTKTVKTTATANPKTTVAKTKSGAGKTSTPQSVKARPDA